MIMDLKKHDHSVTVWEDAICRSWYFTLFTTDNQQPQTYA